VLILPIATLTGVACAAPAMAYAVHQTSFAKFDVVFRLIVTPLFLFSGTFFPVNEMPAITRPLVYAAPLWHCVTLCRGLAVGRLALGPAAGHLLYLTVFAIAGIALAAKSYHRRLDS
jgi:lipooligosaccharide transport system permease protein